MPTEALVDGCLAELAGPQDVAVRLLSDGVGSSQSVHAVNVTVLSLLLGRALGLEASLLRDLGLAALLHDAEKPVAGVDGMHGLALEPLPCPTSCASATSAMWAIRGNCHAHGPVGPGHHGHRPAP